MSDTRRTRFNAECVRRGLGSSTGVLASALDHHQIRDLVQMADATGCLLTLTAAQDASYDTFVLAPAASQTNTITIRATTAGASGLTVAIADAGSDTLAVTVTSGAIAIALANSTDSKNTLTLIKAALDAALTSTTGAIYSTFITGTGSTQMVHGGTNDRAATGAGVLASGLYPSGGLKSSTAGTPDAGSVALGSITVSPS